jgi:hypothetical protein
MLVERPGVAMFAAASYLKREAAQNRPLRL